MFLMHVAFVVHLAQGADVESLFSDEMKKETEAVVMSLDDASKMGLGTSGIQVKAGQHVQIIIVAKRDAPWIHRTLEIGEGVAGFHMADVNIG
jgi:hypothetical protein